MVARYSGAISQADDAVGMVLDALKESGQADNTLVVFTADHGDLCGPHRMVDKHYVMYDEVVRVPLIISWPAGLGAPRMVSSFVSSTLDVDPTILDLLGVERPADTHGKSLRGLMDGTTAERDGTSPLRGALGSGATQTRKPRPNPHLRVGCVPPPPNLPSAQGDYPGSRYSSTPLRIRSRPKWKSWTPE